MLDEKTMRARENRPYLEHDDLWLLEAHNEIRRLVAGIERLREMEDANADGGLIGNFAWDLIHLTESEEAEPGEDYNEFDVRLV